MLRLTKQEFSLILGLFLIWRIVLFGVGYFADAFLIYQPSFPYADAVLVKYDLPRWVYSWANFDGVHYLTIAEHGYKGTGLIQAFFPVYPLIIKILNLNWHYLLPLSLVVSNLAALGTVLLLYQLLKDIYSPVIAWRSCVLFLLFPTSFYLGATYNESLFLLFTLGAFLAGYRKNWLFAGILAGFASATRVVGIFVVIAIVVGVIVEQYQKVNKKNDIALMTRLKHGMNSIFSEINLGLGWLVLGMTGLCSYMLYLWLTYGDPLYFLHVQSEFGSGREEHIILLPQTLWRSLKILITVPFNLRYLTYLQEFSYTVIFFIVLTIGLRKMFKIPYAWTFFSLLAILLPTTTGTLSSMPRYVLVAFPFFVILALQKLPNYIWISLYVLSATLLLINTVLFIQGYWIA